MVNIFQKIFGEKKPLSHNSSSVVGIDIGSSAIKVVEVKKKGGKAVLSTYGAIELGPYADTDMGRVTNLPTDKIIEALKEVLKQASVTATEGALSIAIQSSLVFVVELPSSIKESEMSQIVPTEARKHIPVPITEVSLDYFVLPKRESSFEEANNPDLVKKEESKTEVLVVAIQNDAISRLKSVASETDISTSFFEVEVFSSVRANFEHELSPVLLMDFGASRTKLSFVEFGVVKGYHSISRGGADITDSIATSFSVSFEEAEDLKKKYGIFENKEKPKLAEVIKLHTDYIFSEANSSLLNYEKKHSRTISKVILTGGGSMLKGLKEVAENNFRADVESGLPFSKVGAPEFLEKVLESTGPEFAVAIGLALRRLG